MSNKPTGRNFTFKAVAPGDPDEVHVFNSRLLLQGSRGMLCGASGDERRVDSPGGPYKDLRRLPLDHGQRFAARRRAVSMINQIATFDGEFRFLSNFYHSPFTTRRGQLVQTVEHAFQAAKTLNVDEQAAILAATTPGEAKRLGRRATMRPDWDTLRLRVMAELLRLKFAEGTPLATKLLETRYAELVEGNTWGDRFWGVCDGVGENHLGHLLMQRRYELRKTVAKELMEELMDLGLA